MPSFSYSDLSHTAILHLLQHCMFLEILSVELKTRAQWFYLWKVGMHVMRQWCKRSYQCYSMCAPPRFYFKGDSLCSFIMSLITYYVVIQVHNFILGTQKTHRFSHTVQCYSPVFPLCLKLCLCFSSCLFKAPFQNTKSPLIGQLTNAWASNNRAAALN